MPPAPTAPDHPAGLLIRPGGCMHVADLSDLNAIFTDLAATRKKRLTFVVQDLKFDFVHRIN
ncbi:MAG: hypothetical protein ACOVK7_04020 [Burkholderiaceae bacterium]